MRGIKGFQKGHITTEETRRKIGLANRGIWVKYNCDYCGNENEEKLSHYIRKKRHFCNMKCYSLYRKEKMCFAEQPNYKGIRKIGESKQVYHRNYCKEHPATISHLKARRYARERGAAGNHTLEEWVTLKNFYDNRCAICGQASILTKDHIIPLSEGGSDYIENIQPLCRSCNSKKWKHIYENPELLKS